MRTALVALAGLAACGGPTTVSVELASDVDSCTVTSTEQQATERRDVLKMIERLPLEIIGEPTFGDRPDAHLVLANGRSIGLEHTEVVDRSVARGRGVPDRIRDQLREALIAAGVRALVSVTLPEGASVSITSRVALAREIAAVVAVAKEALAQPGTESRRYEQLREDIVMPDGTVAWHNPKRDEPGLFDLEGRDVNAFSSVKVLPSDETVAACHGTAFWSSHASLIQEAIFAKADDLDEYRKAGDDEQWLLVVGSSGGIGTALAITDAEGEFVSPYDQTIFLELYSGKAVRLKTRPPSAT
jgi:hypothetical protein